MYWWFEIPKFLCTLSLCGLIGLSPADGASQVFISMAVSLTMLVLFANCKPYMVIVDDGLAQFCQVSLTFAMAVGLLERSSSSYQDALYGPLLIICTSINLGVGVIVMIAEFFTAAFPNHVERALSTKVKTVVAPCPPVSENNHSRDVTAPGVSSSAVVRIANARVGASKEDGDANAVAAMRSTEKEHCGLDTAKFGMSGTSSSAVTPITMLPKEADATIEEVGEVRFPDTV